MKRLRRRAGVKVFRGSGVGEPSLMLLSDAVVEYLREQGMPMDADPTSGDGVYRLLWLQPWSQRAAIKVRRRLVDEFGEPALRYPTLAEVLRDCIPVEDVERLRFWVRQVLEEDARIKADPFPREIEYLRTKYEGG